MSKNQDLQKILTSFEQEVGHLKEWQIDLQERARSMAKDAGKSSVNQKKGIHGLSKEDKIKIASKAGKVRGSIIGKANVISGHWAKCHQLAKEACYVSILQCDKKTGTIIKEWKSAVHAMEETGISKTAINNNLKGLSSSSGGYIWKYKNNLDNSN
jgi:hypothetical protein